MVIGETIGDPPENKKKPVTIVATDFFMVDLKRFELSTSRMRKDFVNFLGLFLLLLAVSAGFDFICKPL